MTRAQVTSLLEFSRRLMLAAERSTTNTANVAPSWWSTDTYRSRGVHLTPQSRERWLRAARRGRGGKCHRWTSLPVTLTGGFTDFLSKPRTPRSRETSGATSGGGLPTLEGRQAHERGGEDQDRDLIGHGVCSQIRQYPRIANNHSLGQEPYGCGGCGCRHQHDRQREPQQQCDPGRRQPDE